VPFDGEQQGDSAEILGGPQGAAPLGGDARQAVEQVMLFENAEVDNPRRALPLETPLGLPQLDQQIREPGQPFGILEAMRQVIFGNAQVQPRPPPPPPPVMQLRRNVSPVDRGFLLGTFDRLRGLTGRQAPVSAIRSTQSQPQDDAVVVAEDFDPFGSSDEEDRLLPTRPVHVPRAPRTQQVPRPRTRQEARPAQQIIDLTNDDDGTNKIVVDLTGNDG